MPIILGSTKIIAGYVLALLMGYGLGTALGVGGILGLAATLAVLWEQRKAR